MARKWFGTKPYVEYTSASGGTGLVAYDATGAGNAVASGTNSVNITWSHTCTGSNRIVIVSILVGGVSASYTTFTRSVTYGGNAMTSFGAIDGGATPNGWLEMFYLIAPPTGAQTVSVTVSKAATTFGRVAGNSVSYNNAAQTAPVGTFGSNTGTAASQSLFWSTWSSTNMAGAKINWVFGVDSSTTITSVVTNNARMPNSVVYPNQGTTRWTSNSGATAGMTSLAIGDSDGMMFTNHNVFSAVASRFAGIVVRINSIGVAVPAGIHGCWLTMIGAGGGGGAGRLAATATNRYGGAGGGGGAYVAERYIPASLLGSTYSVYVPPVAAGAAGQSTANTDGASGTRALDVLFGYGTTTISCGSGHGGYGGSSAAQGYNSRGGYTGDGFGFGGTGGYAGTGVGGAGSGAYYANYYTGAGGGAGGGITSANVTANGGVGGSIGELNLAGGVGGTTAGGTPGSGSTATPGLSGSGAGGGASSNTANGQSGANATGYGAGGGGGGASINGFTSGAGGNGGPAYVRIKWDYR